MQGDQHCKFDRTVPRYDDFRSGRNRLSFWLDWWWNAQSCAEKYGKAHMEIIWGLCWKARSFCKFCAEKGRAITCRELAAGSGPRSFLPLNWCGWISRPLAVPSPLQNDGGQWVKFRSELPRISVTLSEDGFSKWNILEISFDYYPVFVCVVIPIVILSMRTGDVWANMQTPG